MILSKPAKEYLSQDLVQTKLLGNRFQILLCLLQNTRHSLSAYEIHKLAKMPKQTVLDNVERLFSEGYLDKDIEMKALKYTNKYIEYYEINQYGAEFLSSVAQCIGIALKGTDSHMYSDAINAHFRVLNRIYTKRTPLPNLASFIE